MHLLRNITTRWVDAAGSDLSGVEGYGVGLKGVSGYDVS